uniref:Uncharacterized protein n=1 Tax=Heliothis virescens TaxID=7102 RepID=A0A2A4IYJ5_HELVI
MLKIVLVAVALAQLVFAGPLDHSSSNLNHPSGLSNLRSSYSPDHNSRQELSNYYQDSPLNSNNLRSNSNLQLSPQQLNDLRALNDHYLRRSEDKPQYPYLRSHPDHGHISHSLHQSNQY